jgi:hypothetical protein
MFAATGILFATTAAVTLIADYPTTLQRARPPNPNQIICQCTCGVPNYGAVDLHWNKVKSCFINGTRCKVKYPDGTHAGKLQSCAECKPDEWGGIFCDNFQ